MEMKMISEGSERDFNRELQQALNDGWEPAGELQVKAASSSSWNQAYSRTDTCRHTVYAIMMKKHPNDCHCHRMRNAGEECCVCRDRNMDKAAEFRKMCKEEGNMGLT